MQFLAESSVHRAKTQALDSLEQGTQAAHARDQLVQNLYALAEKWVSQASLDSAEKYEPWWTAFTPILNSGSRLAPNPAANFSRHNSLHHFAPFRESR
jgi:hypothetical protein